MAILEAMLVQSADEAALAAVALIALLIVLARRGRGPHSTN